jgi:hypothetical protein
MPVRKLPSDGDIGELTETERTGNPVAIAADYLNIGRDREERLIGPPRASSLYESCLRFHLIGYKCRYPEYISVNAATKVIFSLGNAIHSWVQNTDAVIGSNKCGWWECLACGNVIWSIGYPDIECRKCGARRTALRYKEHSLNLERPFLSSGHPDLFIQVGGYTRVVEIKTIAGDAFEKLQYPLIEHSWQLQYYMWACSIDTSLPAVIDGNVGYCLYVSKAPSWKKTPYKMFVARRDPSILKAIKRKLLSFDAGLDSPGYGELHRDCKADMECSRAKWCSVGKYCREFYEAGL